MAPFLWFVLGGAAGAVVGAKATALAAGAVGIMGGTVVVAGVAAIRKKLSPEAQAEFDVAFASLTPDEVNSVLENNLDPDAARIVAIAVQLSRNKLWMDLTKQASALPPPHAVVGATLGHPYGWRDRLRLAYG
jgi:hypothetical protein